MASLPAPPGRLAVTAISALYAGFLSRGWHRFQRAAAEPSRAQGRRLARLLRSNASTCFGQRHGFARIDSPRAFQKKVPIRDYDAYQPWIERVARGERGVLTHDPVTLFERSSGSTSANKLIPYTARLLAEFSAATGPWIFDLYKAHPSLLTLRSYWSISPVTRRRETTSSGIPVGFNDDSEYFGPLQRWALGRLMALPGAVARLPDLESWRRQTSLYLLAAEDLGLISVWSPTFLSLLMESIAEQLDNLLPQLPPRRNRAIREAVARQGRITGEALWPRLKVISSWTDGSSAAFVPRLERWFPRTPIQPKGLLATEGVVSFPLWGMPGAVLAVAGHFLEFIDLDHPQRPDPLLAHQLRQGGCYSPVISTGGGLYRYHLKDVVRCVGWHRNTPLVRFDGKLDAVSDLCGEKLNARHVEQALALAGRETGDPLPFAILSPVASSQSAPPHYCLFVDSQLASGSLARARSVIEEQLLENSHYRYCRQLGQLGPLTLARVQDAWNTYQRAMVAQGARIGDVKPASLDTRGAAAKLLESAVVERIPAAAQEQPQ